MKHEIIRELFAKMIPYVAYCKFKNAGKFSVVTVNGVEGPLPLNATAAKILSLCDGKRTVMDIYKELHDEYSDISEEKLFFDISMCIRNFEVIQVVKIQYT